MSRARMLLVEDDAALAELLTYHFKREDFDVRHTPDGEEALLLAKESAPDIVLLDWMVESLSGIEVCRRLRRMSETANVPIIMLTARGEEEDRVRGLETGADDYVTKPFSPREVVARVAAILRRLVRTPAPPTPGHFTYGGLSLDAEGWRARWRDVEVPLTVTEFSIVRVLADAPRRVFTRDAIIDRVHGPGFAMTDRTIDSHVRNLRAKFTAVGGGDVIETRPGVGYQLGPCLGETV